MPDPPTHNGHTRSVMRYAKISKTHGGRAPVAEVIKAVEETHGVK